MKTQTTKENKYGKIVGEQLNTLPQLLKWRCWQDDDDASTEANILLEEFSYIAISKYSSHVSHEISKRETCYSDKMNELW